MSTHETTADGRPAQLIRIGAVMDQLLRSGNPNDRRKWRDLQQLLLLQKGSWQGRFALLDFAAGPRRSLSVSTWLEAQGLIWEGDPAPCDSFHLILSIPNSYPLAEPLVMFGKPTPFNMNVVHKEFVPNPHGLPAELQQIINEGHDGGCCYMLSAEWSGELHHNLALVVRQVSRMLVGAKLRGEDYSLNNQARDYYLQLQAKGRLPLGPALPLPDKLDCPVVAAADDDADDASDAIELVEVDRSRAGGK
jgi:hypothetical protein